MTPPTAPPEKRPDRHYDFRRLNMVFALCSLGLLATTMWMVFADYAQPWKRYQAEFRSLERQQLLKQAEDEKKKINEQQVAGLQKSIDDAEAKLAEHQSGAADLEDQLAKLKTQIYSADTAWKASKAQLDAARFQLDAAGQKGDRDAIAKGQAETDRLRTQLGDRKKALELLNDQQAAVAGKLAEKRAAITDAEKQLKDLNGGLDAVQTRAANLEKGTPYLLLNAPLMDFLQPTLHVQQAVLPGLYHNINFTNIDRVDRCMTCHVAANRPGFDGPEWKEPFRTHPNLAAFVGDGSPHPYTRFGCTACHGGLDRATDFSRAGHSPKSKAQEEDWKKRLGWEEQPFLENPILPSGLSEAGCATCHASGVWTPQSHVQDAGRELIVHMGCNACHVMDYPAYTNTRKPGPSLERIAGKTNPGWAYKWIAAPRDFHPTTWMPHFFFQENIKTEVDKKRQEVEIVSLVSYLWDKSERPQYPPAPAGDAARGQQLFENVGCAGCHILDPKAKRDDFFPVINRLHGPNLVRTGSKVSSGWLYAWVKNPKQYFPDTSMPNLRLTDQEAGDVVAYLTTNPNAHDARYENQPLPAIDGKLRDELVLNYLEANLTIERSQQKLGTMSPQEKNVYLGQQTILKYGCFSCHDIKGFEDVKPIGTELTAEGSKPLHQFDFGHVALAHTRHEWIETKLLRPRIFDQGKEKVKDYNDLLKMPSFGLSEREAQAILSNVAGFTKESVVATHKAGTAPQTAAMAEGRKLITRYNCQGCHLIEGQGHAIKQLIQDPAMLPPNLAAEGARVQTDWLFKYLHDPSRVKMRPWLNVRMPTFGFTDAQENAIIGYFTSREQRSPFLSPFPGADPRDAAVGAVVFNMFQCAKCHPAGADAAKASGVSADLAPSLLLAPERLRWDWVPSWVKDPQKWVPGTRMPSFFPESTPGQYMSPATGVVDSPAYAAQKAQLAKYFADDAEMKEYLGNADKVTQALRDHIWTLAGGLPAHGETSPGTVSGAAGGAAGGGGRR